MSAVRDTVPSAMNSNGNMVLGDPQLPLLNPDPMVPRPSKAPQPGGNGCSRGGAAVAGDAIAAACPSGSTAHEPPFRPPRSPIARPPGPASSSTTRRSPASRSGCT
jgi:hypothetical protein